MVNDKPRFYTKKEVKEAAKFFAKTLGAHCPATPFAGPISVSIRSVYPWPVSYPRKFHHQCLPHCSTPDVDNAYKLIGDGMTEMGFWHDDAQIYDLHLSKFRGPNPGLEIEMSQCEPGVAPHAVSLPDGSQGGYKFWLAGPPPKTTAQQKGVLIIKGKPMFFVKKKVKDAERLLASRLAPYRPNAPCENPLAVEIRWVHAWPSATPKKRKDLICPHDGRPDVDNSYKQLGDVLTQSGFWKDDSQVYDLRISKWRGPKPGLGIMIAPFPVPSLEATSAPGQGLLSFAS